MNSALVVSRWDEKAGLRRDADAPKHQECGWKDGDSGDSAGEKTVSNKKTKEST